MICLTLRLSLICPYILQDWLLLIWSLFSRLSLISSHKTLQLPHLRLLQTECCLELGQFSILLTASLFDRVQRPFTNTGSHVIEIPQGASLPEGRLTLRTLQR